MLMIKKVFVFLVLLLSMTFYSVLDSEAATVGNFSFGSFNVYGSFYAVRSNCVTIPGGTDIVIFEIGDYGRSELVYEAGGVDSVAAFYTDTTCSVTDLVGSLELYDISPGAFVNTYYEVDLGLEFPDEVITAMRLTIMTTYSSPMGSTFLINLGSASQYTMDEAPYTVKYIFGFNIWEQRRFLTRVPSPERGDPSISNNDFLGWVTRDGDAYRYTIPSDDMFIDGVLYLYASFAPIYEDMEFPTASDPGVYDPLDTILINTGFYNTPGFMILFVLAVLAASVGLALISAPAIVIVLADIMITAVFLFLGYLPLFTALVMIGFYILVFMQRGGLVNE
jgi:hypothetical protein